MNTRMVDVARAAGVSSSTVSQYLSGRYEYMSAETRAKIKLAIEELEFVPNEIARSLKKKQTFTIAKIVSNILNPFSTSSTRGAEDCCKAYGFDLILCNADDSPKKEREYIETLVAKQVDGFIISTTEKNADFLASVNRRIPITIFGRNVPDLGCDIVQVDNFEGIRLATEHLISLGHSRIALFVFPYGEINSSPRRERVHAFRLIMNEYGLPGGKVVEVSDTGDMLYAAVKSVLESDDPPTAFIGANDLMTISLFNIMKRRLQVKIPEDVALVGFDEWPWATLLDPPVTVVAQPTYEMGYTAAELVIKRVQEKNHGYKPQFLVYKPELIVRESCGIKKK